ncbi:hypothetical protein MP638_007111 [Amoeboaphelidium occidentale]|nr:hypothetical protein MP638_007111 [Amoeboaphelidium occidentale]
MSAKARVMKPKQQQRDVPETKEQRQRRLEANQKAQEVALKFVLPALVAFIALFVFAMYYFIGTGK